MLSATKCERLLLYQHAIGEEKVFIYADFFCPFDLTLLFIFVFLSKSGFRTIRSFNSIRFNDRCPKPRATCCCKIFIVSLSYFFLKVKQQQKNLCFFLHFKGVTPNSPADQAGLKPRDDYLLGTNFSIFSVCFSFLFYSYFSLFIP